MLRRTELALLIIQVVFYKMENVGYQYKYAEMTPDLSYTPHYQWELLEWSDCTVKCGGGFQTAKFVCVEDKAGKVSSNFCSGIKEPQDEPKTCNEQPCKTKWKVGKWSECYACKHKSGVKIREVECVRESPRPGAEDILVEDNECTEARPGSRELCNSHKKCKTKKETSIDNLPDDLMTQVWMQTNQKSINKRTSSDESETEDGDDEEMACTFASDKIPTTTTGATKKVHLDVGKIVQDRIPSEEIKLIKVPLKPSHLSTNLSDVAFETMGDSVGDSIDTGKAVESTGDKAAEMLKEMQHVSGNKTKHKNGRGKRRKPGPHARSL